MKYAHLAGAIIAATALAAGMPDARADPPASRAVQVGAFSAIDASRGLRVTVTPGAPSVTLAGDPNYFDRVKVEVVGDTLKLSRVTGFAWHWGGWRDQVVLRVTAPTLTAAEASSGSDVKISLLAAGALSLSASSGGDIRIDGTCGALTASASSGGGVGAKGLRCSSAIGHASSGGDVSVFATVSASGHASSGGDVSIYGPARIDEVDESSGGDVNIHH